MAKDNTKSLFEFDEPADDVSVAGHIITVAFDSGVDSCFDYAVPDDIWPIEIGARVQVPFGRSNKTVNGFCVAIKDSAQVNASQSPGKKRFRLKKVKQLIDNTALLDRELLTLAQWISDYYVCPLGQVLAAVVPAAVKKGAGVRKETYIYLNKAADINAVKSSKQKAIIEVLKQAAAYNADAGIAKAVLLQRAGCATAGPLKHLLGAALVKAKTRTVLKAKDTAGPIHVEKPKDITLNVDQASALDAITSQIADGSFNVDLLYGVTDSGKTEVYIRAIEDVIAKGKSAIVLLPEIALTAQTIQRFSVRFKNIAVMHSKLTAAQRNAQWQKIKSGNADVIIGARSAVFAPTPNLGLIVVDEEHEPSFKQDTVPRYHGRDVAIKRAQLADAVCLLGSATPSLETLHNCKTKKHFTMLELPNRVSDLPMPEMKLVNLRDCKSAHGVELISDQLKASLEKVIDRGEQAILLLNRRGYSNFVYCPSCSHSLHCHNCDVTLTFHRRPGQKTNQLLAGKHMAGGFAICHYCLAKTVVPKKCPLCSKSMTMIGLGSQRLEEELIKKLPAARIQRVDSDSMNASGSGNYHRLLADFAAGKIDILAGTQMLAKGLHFPNVTLVGVISADTSLTLPDFRANERTFQMLCQVAGRAGRSDKKGTVIIQTLMPSQPAIKYALENDFKGFVAAELDVRQKCQLPPYGKMAMIGLRDAKFDRLEQACKSAKEIIDAIIAVNKLDLTIRGPMPAAISRLGGYHRMQIVVQSLDLAQIRRFFTAFRDHMTRVKPAVHIAVDVDPVNLLSAFSQG